MTQYVINIGALPNDGTGDPLRTAFNEVNLNFNQVWATGLVGSNLQIANNTILTTNTNGNLILNPNGIGLVQANAHVIPDQNRIRNLGSATRRWDSLYVQYANIGGNIDLGGNFGIAGDLSVGGNLSVTGNIVYIGNLVTDAKTIQLANTAGTANAANGSGITVGANDNIATFLYDSADNAWVTNVRFETGNLILTDDRIMDLYGPSITNADLISGSTSGLDIVPNGDANATVLYNTYGNLLLQTSNTGSNVKTFTFDYSGNLTLPTNTANINYANGVSILNGVGSGNTIFNGTSNVTIPVANGNVTINANGAHTWNFETTGNLTLPAVNYIQTPVGSNANINLHPDGSGLVKIRGGAGSISGVLLNLTSDEANSLNRIEIDTVGNSNILGGTFTGSFSRGNISSPSAVLLGDRLASLRGRGYDGTALAIPTGIISIDAFDNWSAGDTPTRLSFLTCGYGNSIPLLRMQIDPDGNVNIFDGNITVQGGGYLFGNSVTGNSALFAGIPGYTSLGSNVVAQFSGNANSYSQINFQNTGNGTQASGDFIITADNGDDSNNFIDMGIASSTWDGTQDNSLGTDVGPNDGYLYVNGANLVVGTAITGGAVSTWKFDNTGNLNLPNNGSINFNNGGGIYQSLNEDLVIRASDDESDGWSIYNVVDDGAGNALTQTRLEYNQYSIRTNIQGATSHTWQFNDSGTLGLPGNIAGNYGGNLFVSIGDQPASDTFIDLRTISYVGDALISNIRIANPNVTVSTASGAYNWTFDGSGNLNLPPSGNIVGQTANNSGHINWFGNSSGDNNGYTTLRLVPDDTRESSDQYLIIDPTAPGHIHIRAGGTQDNSNADLFLGGENSYFKVNAGANNEVRISANSHAWTFGADSILTVPGEGVIRSIQDTVILQSYDINGNTYSARLGTTGGMYFETTEYPGGWLSLTNNAGNANITAASGTAGGAGKNIYITAGSADQGDYYTTPGGDVNITAGLGAFNDGGGGGHGGNVNITAGLSADPAGVAGNVTIGSGTNYWQFINNGNLYVPGQINGDNNGNLVIDGAGYGNGYISLPASSFGGEQITIVNDFSLGNGIRLQTNGGNLFFNDSADLSVTGNITGNYFIGNGSQLTGLPASYSDSNVTTLLAAYGSNTISTSGNITAGNLSVTGNVVGNIAFTGGDILINNATGNGGSDEGGELHFAAATANSTLSGPIAIDIYQNKMRFFETEGNTFGMFIDIANSMGVAGSSLGVPAIGYRDVPQISLSANVTANVTNAGKHFYSTTAGNITLTIPDNANVAFPTGATLTIVMNAAGNVIVAQGTGVSLYMAGSSTTGNRVVGAYGLASVMKVATNTWVISGTGVY